MSDIRVLKIGIASRDEIKRRSIAIAKGDRRRAPDEPTVWFSSLDSLAKVLSQRNMLLLEIIRKMQPRSISELAEQSGRAKSNLTRTIHSMERLGLIELVAGDHGRKMPRTKYDTVRLECEIGSTAA